MRVVVSLTTLPARLEAETIIKTLESLQNQTYKPDAVYLTLPKISRRLGTPYPKPSQKILNLCEVVTIEEDYGPVCKILGGLYAESDPNTIIITVDDDIIYDPKFIEEMLKKHEERPEAAIGSSGVIIGKFPGYIAYIRNAPETRYEAWWGAPVPETGYAMDILCGYSGVLYTRGMFPEEKKLRDEFLEIPMKHRSLFLHDDIYISAFLNSRDVPRYVYVMPEAKFAPQASMNALSGSMPKFMKEFAKALRHAENEGLLKTRVPVSTTQTVGGRIVLFVVLIVVLLFLVYYVMRDYNRRK